MNRAYEREEENLENLYQSGEITRAEYDEAMRDLQREYRAAAEEAARDAYEDEMNRWF